MSTPKHVAQIEALLTEAGQAGDRIQVAICLVALGRLEPCAVIDETRPYLERIGIYSERADGVACARAECWRVIDQASAQVQS